MSILGTRVSRTEDPRLLRGDAVYVADLEDARLAGAVHAAFVRSPTAHGLVRAVDVSAAADAPGVVAVYSGADVDVGPMPANPPLINQAMARPLLATGRVRFVGEPVALVLAESEAQAADAAELVSLDIEDLEPVLDPRAAADSDTVLFPEAGTNVALEMRFGADDDLRADCDVVVTAEFHNQRLAACPLEGRAAAAAPDGDELVVWVSTQAAHGVHRQVTTILDRPPDSVRVIAPDVGGGFGPKISAYAEEILVAWAAARLERPVRWVETRSENMVAMGQGRAQHQRVTIGGRPDGRVLAYRLDVVQDAGAYPALGAFLPSFTRMMASGTYDIARVECDTVSVVTNTTPTVAYRGAGRPEATAAIERAMDLFAAEVGMDPVEMRRRNLIGADSFPHTTPTGSVYDSGDYIAALDALVEAAGYDELRAEQQRRSSDLRRMGIGVSTYVEITAGPSAGSEYGRVVVTSDGRAQVFSGSSAHGQGHGTSFAMLVADELGLELGQIEVTQGDTALVPRGIGTFGSRSLQLGGAAVAQAASELRQRAVELAAELFEAAPADIVVGSGAAAFSVAGSPTRTVDWSDVVTANGGPLEFEADFKGSTPTYPFGAHLAVVEVDVETGAVELTRFVAVDDAGTIINPTVVEGQRHGGIAQGVAQALCEEVRFDAAGNPVTANLGDYGMISACELPPFELVTMETPTAANPLGVKGIGESGTIGAMPAVVSAVCDALRPLGVVDIDPPCTPERVWAAMAAAPATRPRAGRPDPSGGQL